MASVRLVFLVLQLDGCNYTKKPTQTEVLALLNHVTGMWKQGNAFRKNKNHTDLLTQQLKGKKTCSSLQWLRFANILQFTPEILKINIQMWVREKRGENTENLILSRGITLPKNCLHQVVQQQIQGLTGGKKKKKKKPMQIHNIYGLLFIPGCPWPPVIFGKCPHSCCVTIILLIWRKDNHWMSQSIVTVILVSLFRSCAAIASSQTVLSKRGSPE